MKIKVTIYLDAISDADIIKFLDDQGAKRNSIIRDILKEYVREGGFTRDQIDYKLSEIMDMLQHKLKTYDNIKIPEVKNNLTNSIDTEAINNLDNIGV